MSLAHRASLVAFARWFENRFYAERVEKGVACSGGSSSQFSHKKSVVF